MSERVIFRQKNTNKKTTKNSSNSSSSEVKVKIKGAMPQLGCMRGAHLPLSSEVEWYKLFACHKKDPSQKLLADVTDLGKT